MRNPLRRYRKWLKEVRLRRSQPPIERIVLTVDERGFSLGEKHFLWTEITKIRIYLVDFFMYDRVEVCLTLDSKILAITEGDSGFLEFIKQFQITFPVVEEPLGFLSHHAFSTEVFEFDATSF